MKIFLFSLCISLCLSADDLTKQSSSRRSRSPISRQFSSPQREGGNSLTGAEPGQSEQHGLGLPASVAEPFGVSTQDDGPSRNCPNPNFSNPNTAHGLAAGGEGSRVRTRLNLPSVRPKTPKKNWLSRCEAEVARANLECASTRAELQPRDAIDLPPLAVNVGDCVVSRSPSRNPPVRLPRNRLNLRANASALPSLSMGESSSGLSRSPFGNQAPDGDIGIDKPMWMYLSARQRLKELLQHLPRLFGNEEILRVSISLPKSISTKKLLKEIEIRLNVLQAHRPEVLREKFEENSINFQELLTKIRNLNENVDRYFSDIRSKKPGETEPMEYVLHTTNQVMEQLEAYLDATKTELE